MSAPTSSSSHLGDSHKQSVGFAGNCGSIPPGIRRGNVIRIEQLTTSSDEPRRLVDDPRGSNVVTCNNRNCILCPVYWRDGLNGRQAPSVYEHPYACEACRRRVRNNLRTIAEEFVWLDATPHSASGREWVSGTKDIPMGVRIDILDQMSPGPLRMGEVFDPFGDQTGAVPAVVVLERITVAWYANRSSRGIRERRPIRRTVELCRWLWHRVDSAIEHLPDTVAAHVAAIRILAGRLSTLNGGGWPMAELVQAVPCPNCDQVALARWPGLNEVYCAACGHLGTREDLQRWVKLLLAQAFRERESPAPEE